MDRRRISYEYYTVHVPVPVEQGPNYELIRMGARHFTLGGGHSYSTKLFQKISENVYKIRTKIYKL